MSKIARIASRFWKSFHARVEQTHLVLDFLRDPVWKVYGVSLWGRWRYWRKIRACHTSIRSASDPWRSLLYVREILRVPSSIQGDVIEFGCFKGASSAALSIACKLAGRKLIVCDSFAGLPDPVPGDRDHRSELKTRTRVEYKAGDFCGGLEEVQRNVALCGEPSVVRYVPGYFEASLPKLELEGPKSFVFALLDVDLFQSTAECLRYVWPKLEKGSKLYTDDGGEIDIAAMFFEREWWRKEFGEDPPGMFGAGSGINFFQTRYSAVGMALKGHRLAYDEIARSTRQS